jgi:ferric-dicitrate binding protein FerR (iron transport regulator)
VPVPGSETIVTGDVLTTSAEGSALVELEQGTRVKIAENSSIRFLQDGEMVRAELLSGAVVSESVGKPTMIVSTPTYQFAPGQEKECRYSVQLSREQATVAAAMQGNVIVKAREAGGSYILREGTYAVISPGTTGVPDQATAAGGQLGTQLAGTVINVIPDGVVQRVGKGAEIPLKVNDEVGWEDVVRTLQDGRLRIALSGGPFLNLGTRSTMKVVKHDPKMRQTQIELTSGAMRVWVVKLDQPGSSFKLQTPTAVTGVVGSDFIVEAQPFATRVYCIEGMVSVRNIDPAVTGQVILHAGEFATVAPGLSPTKPVKAPDALLQSEIDQTMVPPAAAGRRRLAAGWHIGSLTEAQTIGVLAELAAGATADIAVPLLTAPSPSPSNP